jgi:hypothetical protein
MDKGKNNATQHKSTMDKQEAGASRNKNKKVSSEDDPHPIYSTDSHVYKQRWEGVRVLKDTTCICRVSECKGKAVVVWVKVSEPDNEWHLCEECQKKQFRGLPANLRPPKHVQSEVNNKDDKIPNPKQTDDKEPDEVTTEEKKATTRDTPTADETCNDEEFGPGKVTNSNCSKDSNSNNGDEADGEEGEEMEEVWDVKKVMSFADIKDCPIKCSNETCTLAAACIYVSNLAPTEDWYTCLDCQVSNMLRARE